jgi:hypothetical protein
VVWIFILYGFVCTRFSKPRMIFLCWCVFVTGSVLLLCGYDVWLVVLYLCVYGSGVLLHWSRYWFGTALHLSTVSYRLVWDHTIPKQIQWHTHTHWHKNTGCPITYQTRQFFNILPLMRILQRNLKRTADTFLFISHLRTYSCSNLITISSLVLELLKNCRVR